MNFLFDVPMNRLLSIIALAILLTACSGGAGKSGTTEVDLHQREMILLSEGLIYYGDNPGAEVTEEFGRKVQELSEENRALLEDVFNDYADLADLANYAYKDSDVALPKGWVDLGAEDPKLGRLISGYFVSGLKCSLMAKGDRKALVFAGTDFPADWKNLKGVMDFIMDAYEDVDGALNPSAAQVVAAGNLVDELLAAGYVKTENLEFAGHSLGGRLASEMAVRYSCPAVIFNAAGVSPEVYKVYDAARKAADEHWRGYIVAVASSNDPLTFAQKYMSGSSDPFVSTVANALSVDKKAVESVISLVSGSLDNVMAKYADVVDKYYERDYRALGAVMPIQECVGGHGIKELAASLRARALLLSQKK